MHTYPKVIIFAARLAVLLPFDTYPIKTCSNVELIQNMEGSAETGIIWPAYHLETLVRVTSRHINLTK